MKNITQTPFRGRLARLAAVACLAAAGMLLAACAYTQTMQERDAEGTQLRLELEQEQAKTRNLTR